MDMYCIEKNMEIKRIFNAFDILVDMMINDIRFLNTNVYGNYSFEDIKYASGHTHKIFTDENSRIEIYYRFGEKWDIICTLKVRYNSLWEEITFNIKQNQNIQYIQKIYDFIIFFMKIKNEESYKGDKKHEN